MYGGPRRLVGVLNGKFQLLMTFKYWSRLDRVTVRRDPPVYGWVLCVTWLSIQVIQKQQEEFFRSSLWFSFPMAVAVRNAFALLSETDLMASA